MSTPSLRFPDFTAGQTSAAGHIQALGSNIEPFEPTLSATTTDPTLGTGAVRAGYWTQQGAWIHFVWFIQFGSSGVSAGSGTYRIELPLIAAHSPFARLVVGKANLRDDSIPGNRGGSCVVSSGDASVLSVRGDYGTMRHDTPWLWAANDILAGSGSYIGNFVN